MRFIQQNTIRKNIVSTNFSADNNIILTMKFFKYILLITLFFVVGCSKNRVSSNFKPKNNITFDVGFNPSFEFCGSFFDKKNSNELIYFADPVTNKVIKFFNPNGKIQDSISLKNLSKATSTILSLKVISKDTLLFFNYTQIIAVNSKGNVFKLIDLQFLTQNDPSNEIYEFMSNNEANKNSLLLGLNWVKNKNENKDLSDVEYFSESFKKPSIIKINKFLSDSISYTYSSHNHYNSLYNSPKIFSERFRYKQTNNKVFLISFFSNNLLEYDINKLVVLKKIPIVSDFTKIGIEPLKVDDPDFSSETVIQKNKMAGAITGLFYNYKTKQYIVLVRHQIEKDFVYKEKERPFSIIRYDKSFNKISEVVANKEQFDYYGYNLIQTQNGIIILNNKNTNDKKLSFSIFD